MFYTKPRRHNFIKRFVGIYLVLTILGTIFLSGLYVGWQRSAALAVSQQGQVLDKDKLPSYLLQNVDFGLFWDVWNLVKEKSLEQPIPDTQLFYGALSGIVASLNDPYSVFFDPDMTRKFMEELNGRFDGIGAEIGIKKDQLVIVAPLPETPAERAGLKAGDKIMKIDDKITLGMPIDVAVSNIRGPQGTTVMLKIMRNSWQEARDFSIVREEIHVQSVTYKELGKGLGYIRIIHFNESTPALFEEALNAVLAKNPKGIVLDMRNNPGGLLEAAVRVASEWVNPPGAVVIQRSQDGKREEFAAQGQARLRGIPTVVLVNQGTASGAEIVAGALQDYKQATILGEKTFGKGSVQDFEQLRGGSALKITVAEWLTPNGRGINNEGIAPDVEVKMKREDYENDKDPQLDKAIELLMRRGGQPSANIGAQTQ